MIQAQFTGEKIFSTSENAFSLYEKSRLGEKVEKKIEYSLVEALFLLFQKKAKIFQKNKEFDFSQFLRKLKRLDKKIETKFSVFQDLRKKGYIVKTALKFGAEFRVYEKGVRPGQDHAKWILYTSKENETFNWHDFSSKNRVAHSTKKNLLLAILDEEGDISYYEISWIKP